MSFEELAKRIAGHPNAQAHAAARTTELARRPWHDAFLADVYPGWQGPLVRMSRKAGIESATHSAGPAPSEGSSWLEVSRALPPRDWVLAEWLVVSAAVGVSAVLGYLFAGDENDGAMARVGAIGDAGLTYLPEISKAWAGPRGKLIQDAIDDVPAAAALFGTLLVKALDAKEARLEAEAEAARVTEARRIEAEAKAEADAIAARLAAETAAHPDNQPDEPDQPAEPDKRDRREEE
jgi:hypothetical protein